MSSFDNGPDPAGDSVDDLGRRAGGELRRPAPADGLANVHRSRRRRRTAAAGGGLAVAILAVGGGILLANRGDDDDGINISDSTIASSIPATTATVPTTQPSTPTTATTDTTAPAVESVPTTEPVIGTIETIPPTESVVDTTEPVVSTTVPESESTVVPPAEAESSWVSTDEEWPLFAYVGEGGFWEGVAPSPAIPDDPGTPLAPGAYSVGMTSLGASAMTLEVYPFEVCDGENLPELHSCFDPGSPIPGTVGIPPDAVRTVELAVDSVTVHLTGFGCDGTGLVFGDDWIGTGRDLAQTVALVNAAVETTVLQPLREGADADELADSLRTNQPNGISDPECPGYTNWVWTSPSGGPTLMIDLYLPDGVPTNPDLAGPNRHRGAPTGLEIRGDGSVHLYYHAGFIS